MKWRVTLQVGILIAVAGLAGCKSSAGHSEGPTTSQPAPTTTAASGVPSGAVTTTTVTQPPVGGNPASARCPTLSEANGALGATYGGGPIQSSVRGIGVVCEYTGGPGGNAGVTIFAHQSDAVYAGQVANAGRSPGMQRITGVGDGGFGLVAGGRSIVNAYANASHTVVAAQSPQSLAATESLARVALSDNS